MLDKFAQDNYADETKPLFKMLRTEAFRFVIVSFNHYSLPQRLEADLKARFPDRPFLKIDARTADYQTISAAYAQLGSGFCWLDNFDDLLKTERDSLGNETPAMARNNERRRHITAGLNLRRDRLAQSPVALFVLVPTTAGEQFVRIIMEKMPDLWSFRSFILDLQLERQAVTDRLTLPATTALHDFAVNEQTRAAAEAELQRLLAQYDNTPDDETAYRLTLYPQIADKQAEIGHFQKALLTLGQWQREAPASDLGDIYYKRGTWLERTGQLNEALAAFEQALLHFEEQKSPLEIARCYKKTGDVFKEMGNLEQAMQRYLRFKQQTEALVRAEPDNSVYKNELGVSYTKLGSTHSALGNLPQALAFFEQYNQLSTELHEAYPANVEFKNSLASSYAKLGETYSVLGDLPQALAFFEQDIELSKELHEAYLANVDFKKGLAISYQFLGITHSALGNLPQALAFFEQFNQLLKELHEAYPANVYFKNGLAISYAKLGETYSALGNFPQALAFFVRNNQLSTELHEAYPANVDFKYGLASSYLSLGQFHRDQLKDRVKARSYIQKGYALYEALVQDFPDYQALKGNYVWAKMALSDLEK